MAPARLGELLETRGQITREQLMRALRNQKVLGGRLGTCLLEIEALTEEQLSSALAEQYGVPFATPEDLRGIPDDVLELLPAKVARRCRAIAFHSSSTQVKVALIEARNLAIQDEISFVIGKRIRWHVAPELRVIEALEKHYGEECPSRLAKLLDKMNRSRFLWARESAAISPPATGAKGRQDQLSWDARIAGVASESTEAPGPAGAPDSAAVELTPLQLPAPEMPAAVAPPSPPSARLPSPSPSLAKAGPPGSPGAAVAKPAELTVAPHHRLTVQETEQRLLRPSERDDVARALLDFAAGLAQKTVLFVVRKDEIASWFWSGEGIDEPKLAAFRLPLRQPSVFAGLKQSGAMFRGRLSPMPAHLALVGSLGERALSGSVLVLPVRVKDRLVAALFLASDESGGLELTPEDLAELERVIAKAEIGFELCIMQSKLRRA